MDTVLSLLAFLPFLVPAVVAQFGERQRWARYATYALLLALNASFLLLGLVILLLDAFQFAPLLVADVPVNLSALAVAILLSALLANVPLLPTVRRWLARWLPIDPDSPVHATALALAVYQVGLTLGQMAFIGDLEALAEAGLALSIWDVILSGLPLLLFAVVGVGLLVRRDGRATLERLGLFRPTILQLLAALGIAVLLIGFDFVVNAIWEQLDPTGYDRLQRVTETIFGNLITVAGAITLGLSAGISEEILFRGAVQPRLGLFLATLLFTLGHLQYSLTVATAEIFVIGLVLGLVRRRMNTSITIVIHAAYNTIGVLLGLLQP